MTILEIILSTGLAAIGTIFGALVRVLWKKFESIEDKAEQAEQDLMKFKLEVAKDYVSSDELKEALAPISESLKSFKEAIFRKLDNIEEDVKHMGENFRDRLDRKQDKPQ